ncbi:MAG: hypothetical protein ACR2KT_00410 [Methylocella sp.]
MDAINLPHQFVYETEDPVPVSDVVASLLAAEQLLRELALMLEGFIPGLSVEKIEVSVQEIRQGSLKEILAVALFVCRNSIPPGGSNAIPSMDVSGF